MTNLISGKEALIALANDQDVEYMDTNNTFKSLGWGNAFGLETNLFFSDRFKFRLKQKTTMINGIDVPSPQHSTPKSGDDVFTLDFTKCGGYVGWKCLISIHTFDEVWWKTECEIKQVVAALRTIFKTD